MSFAHLAHWALDDQGQMAPPPPDRPLICAVCREELFVCDAETLTGEPLCGPCAARTHSLEKPLA